MLNFIKYSSLNSCAILFKTSTLFLTSILIVKNLGVASFGLISLITAYSGLIGYLCSSGLDIGLVKILTQEHRRSKNFVRIIFLKLLLFFILQKFFIIVFFISVMWYQPIILDSLPDTRIIIYLSFHSFYTVLIQVFGAILKGQGKFKFCLFVEQILFPVTSLTLIYFSIKYADAKIELICLSMMIAAFLNFFIICAYIWVDIATSGYSNQRHTISLRALLYQSFPTSLVNLVTTLGASLTIILAGFYLSENDVGLIAVCQRFSFFAHLALMGLLPFLNTSMGEDLDKNRIGRLERRLKIVSGIAFYWAVFILVAGSLYSFWIFDKLEVNNQHATVVFLIFLIGVTLAAYSRPFSFLLMLGGWTRYNLAITLISLSVLVLSTYVLANVYGVIGVAFASTVYFVIISALRLILVQKKLHISHSFFQLIITICVLGAFCSLLNVIQQYNNFLLSSMVFTAVAISMILYLKEKLRNILLEKEESDA